MSASTPLIRPVLARGGIAVLLTALTAGALAGCSTDGVPADSGDAINIRVVAGMGTPMQAFVDEFNASQDEVVAVLEETSDVATVLPQLSSADAPDVFTTGLGAGDPQAALALAANGLLADLSDQSWMATLPEVFVPGSEDENGRYVYPLTYGMIGTVYNEQAFDEAGVAIPTTLSEFYEACTALSAAGYVPLTYSAKDTPLFLGFASAASLVFGPEPDFSQLQAEGQRTFAASEGWAQSFQLLLDLEENGCTSPDVVGLSNDDAINQVAGGEAAMTVTVIELLKVVQEAAPDIDFGFFPFPATDVADEVTVPLGSGSGYGIPSASTKQEAAKKFLDWLYTEENVRAYAEAFGALPTIGLGTDDTGLPEAAAAMQPALDEGRTTVYINQNWPNAAILRTYIAGIQQVVTGQAPIDQVLQEMDATYSQ